MQEGHYWDPAGTDANHGKHTTPTFIDNDTDPAAPTGTNEVKLYNKGGVLQTIKQGGTSVPVGIPSGTKMLFKQSTAPTGWTFVAEDNDRVLINTSTVSEGGALGGDWTISGISVGSHALTEAELPAITIETYGSNAVSGPEAWTAPGAYSNLAADSSVAVWARNFGSGNQAFRTPNTLGQAHNHSLTLGNTWRPAYAKVITCTKD
jgi:hypothetical protein